MNFHLRHGMSRYRCMMDDRTIRVKKLGPADILLAKPHAPVSVAPSHTPFIR